MEGKNKSEKSDKPEKKLEKKSEKVSDKRLVQLNLQSVSSSIKSAHISDKRPSKVQRTSSSDTEPINTDVFDELKSIQESLLEIRATMMKKDDIKNIVTDIVSEIKGELKKEIITEVITEVKDTLTKELSTTVTTQVKDEFIKEIDEKSKIFESRTKEIADGMNMDMNDLKEKFHEQLAELRYLKANLQEYKSLTVTAYTQANQNMQYSQKNNIKFIGWKEKAQEDLRSDLIAIMKQTTGVTVEPSDILEIHRIPGEQGRIRPVIAKLRNSDSKIKIIKHRSKDGVKSHFKMYDHITHQNAELLRQLNKDERIQSSWYYNGKIFALDNQGVRHKFDILDSIDKKLKKH